MPLPLIDTTTQQQIAVDIQCSFTLRRKSEQLLDSAKRAVGLPLESFIPKVGRSRRDRRRIGLGILLLGESLEMAIEEGEMNAMQWLS